MASELEVGGLQVADGSNDVAVTLGNSSYGMALDYSSGDLSLKTNTAPRLTISNLGVSTFGSGAGRVEISGENNYGLIKTGSDFFNLSADTSGSGAGGGTETFDAPSSIFAIYIGDGQGALFYAEYQSITVTKLAGSTVFAAGSSSGDIRVFKENGSNATVSVRNYRTGSSANLKVIALGV